MLALAAATANNDADAPSAVLFLSPPANRRAQSRPPRPEPLSLNPGPPQLLLDLADPHPRAPLGELRRPCTLNGHDSSVDHGISETISARVRRPRAIDEHNDSIGLGVSEAIGARVGRTRALDGRNQGVGLGIRETIGACVGCTLALDGGNSGVSLGVGKAIGARVGRLRALDERDGGVGLGVGKAIGALVEHAAEVADAQGQLHRRRCRLCCRCCHRRR